MTFEIPGRILWPATKAEAAWDRACQRAHRRARAGVGRLDQAPGSARAMT